MVGDPIQIEPVVTIDNTIIEDIKKSYSVESNYLSSSTSVQRLADLANPYGTYKEETQEWIGIPLWVHRRCLNPMFNISNKIAYGEKMVLPEDMKKLYKPEDNLGGSKWVSIKGDTAENKQFVKQQGEFILDYVRRFFEEEEALKNEKEKHEERAIYIISPFTEIVQKLKDMFKNSDLSMHSYSLKVDEWIKKCIGTVHTFQGKEAHTVLFVCGTDKNSEGARKWICEKPNLLNVAATRAKKRFVLIADESLFKFEDYFKDFYNKLIIEKFPSENESDCSNINCVSEYSFDEDFEEYLEENVELIEINGKEYFFDVLTEQYVQIDKKSINEYSIYIDIDGYSVKVLWRDDKSDPVKISLDEITKDFIRLRNILKRINIKDFPEFILEEVMYNYKNGRKNIILKIVDDNNILGSSFKDKEKQFEKCFFETANKYSEYYTEDRFTSLEFNIVRLKNY